MCVWWRRLESSLPLSPLSQLPAAGSAAFPGLSILRCSIRFTVGARRKRRPGPEPVAIASMDVESLGRDPLGRKVGAFVATGCVCFVLYACLVYAFSTLPVSGMSLLLVSGWGLYSAYEIYRFSHGRPTFIPRMGSYEATPANTGMRTVGLALDLVVMAICAWLFLRGI